MFIVPLGDLIENRKLVLASVALSAIALAAAACAIDFGVRANLVLGFRAIFALAPEARAPQRRLSGLAVRRRGGRLSRRRLGLRARRLDACLPGRACAPPLVALARFLFSAAAERE
jgi:hypothetical protein